MKRRDFILSLGGATVVPFGLWPHPARAQRPGRMRRLGVLMALAADDPETQIRVAPLLQGLEQLGWTVGRNLQIDWRYGASSDNRGRIERFAKELLALGPEVVVTNTGSTAAALQQASRTVPIVDVGFIDPVANGLVESLARPGGNITGFTSIEYGISGKWLELLKQIAPGIKRAAVIRDPSGSAGPGQYGAIQAAAQSLGVELRPVDLRDTGAIERSLAGFGSGPNSGLVVLSAALAIIHRELIVKLAARHRLPAVYPARQFVTGGGLVSYGPVTIDQWRLAAGYVDRILKGEKPADLPIQAPTTYETVLNVKTAKALGLNVPDIVLLRADEVIE